jgi:hypothetical protein
MDGWHWLAGTGAAFGIGNTAFLIYNQMFRYRPIASVTATRGWSGEGHATPTLRVQNTAPYNIVIERFSVSPPYCTISAKSEIRAIVASQRPDVPTLLGPKEERQFVIVVRDRTKSNETIKIVVDWRPGHSTWPRRQWPVTVRTSIDDIKPRERDSSVT